jgi:Ca2+-binding RTX toxin-like protein
MTGTAGADVMFGTSGGDIIRGGAGNDYIDGGGAPKGEVDRLDGGAGNDHIVMNARVVASGGSGADTFLISAAPPTDKTESLLGVVLDYSSAAGDHLAVQGKGTVTVVSAAAVSDVLAVQGVTLGESTVSQVTDVTKAVAGTRVGFDLNGDGREDAFILLGGATLTTFKVGFVVQNEPPGPVNPVTLVGQSPDASHTGVASTSS